MESKPVGGKIMPGGPASDHSVENIPDPYKSFLEPEHFQVCTAKDHVRKKNCVANPWCLFGLGEARDGIYKLSPAVIGNLGPDPAEEIRKPGAPVGIKNLGATCYLNVLIQAMYHNLLVRDAVYNLNLNVNSRETPGDDTEHSCGNGAGSTALDVVMKQLQSVFAHLQLSKRAVYDLRTFAMLLQLSETEQQDPIEFYKLFMGRIEAEDERHKSMLYFPEYPTLSQLLAGVVEYSTVCHSCGKVSAKCYPCNGIELPVDGHNSVDAALCSYFADEILCGDNSYFCDAAGCQCKREATRRTKIQTAPPLINIQLLRYQYDRKTFAKVKSRKKMSFADTMEINGEQYRLTSVLYHQGRSAYDGHYVSEVLEWISGKWWYCDDVKTRQTDNPAESSCIGMKKDPVVIVGTPSNEASKGAESGTKRSTSKSTTVQKPKAIDKRPRKTAESADSLRLDRAQDAYMLSYVRIVDYESVIRRHTAKEVTTPSSTQSAFFRNDHLKPVDIQQSALPIPADVVTAVHEDSEDLAASVKEYAAKKAAVEAEIQFRKKQYQEISSIVPVAGELTHIVPTSWLSQWISGVYQEPKESTPPKSLQAATDLAIAASLVKEEVTVTSSEQAVVDLTDAKISGKPTTGNQDSTRDTKSGVFNLPIHNAPFLCNHSKNSFGSSGSAALNCLQKFKVVSDEAFRVMTAPVNGSGVRVDVDFNSDSLACESCRQEYTRQYVRANEKSRVYTSIMSMIDADDQVDLKNALCSGPSSGRNSEKRHEEYFLLLKTWITSLKKYCDVFADESTAASRGASHLVQNYTPQESFIDGGGKEKVQEVPLVDPDPTVNSSLLCEHGNIAINSMTRCRKVHRNTWEFIKREFPEAISWSSEVEQCALCREQQQSRKSIIKDAAKERSIELSKKGADLRSLSSNASRVRMYPAAFDDPTQLLAPSSSAALGGQRFHAVEANWLNSWRAYHENLTGKVSRPGPILNSNLYCDCGSDGCILPDSLACIAGPDPRCPNSHPRVGSLGTGLPPVELLAEKQYEALVECYGNGSNIDESCAEAPLKRQRIEGSSENGEPIAAEVPHKPRSGAVTLSVNADTGLWQWEPLVCSTCVKKRKDEFLAGVETFVDRPLTVIVLRPGDLDPVTSKRVSEGSNEQESKSGDILNGEGVEKQVGSTKGEGTSTDAISCSPVPLRAGVGQRRSSRRKACQTFDITASSDDTLALIKLKNSEFLETNFDGRQMLYHNHRELTGNDLTLFTLGVKAGDVIYVRVEEEEDSALDSFSSIKSARSRAEVGFNGTFLSSTADSTPADGRRSFHGVIEIDDDSGEGLTVLDNTKAETFMSSEITEQSGLKDTEKALKLLQAMVEDMELPISRADIVAALQSSSGDTELAMSMLTSSVSI